MTIANGKIAIQTYTPKPEPTPAKPWYAFVMPDRVLLNRVVCNDTDVTWRLRNKTSGFFNTKLLITPHGRDFNYYASGGSMRVPLVPELQLQGVHVLITHQLLTLYNLDLLAGKKPAGKIGVHGIAGWERTKAWTPPRISAGFPSSNGFRSRGNQESAASLRETFTGKARTPKWKHRPDPAMVHVVRATSATCLFWINSLRFPAKTPCAS